MRQPVRRYFGCSALLLTLVTTIHPRVVLMLCKSSDASVCSADNVLKFEEPVFSRVPDLRSLAERDLNEGFLAARDEVVSAVKSAKSLYAVGFTPKARKEWEQLQLPQPEPLVDVFCIGVHDLQFQIDTRARTTGAHKRGARAARPDEEEEEEDEESDGGSIELGERGRL
jgi:hypothetical protein